MEKGQGRRSSYLQLLVSLWCTLSLIFLPFPFQLLPNIGVSLSKWIIPWNEKLSEWVGVNIHTSFLISDSLAFYTTGISLGVLTLFITLLICWKFSLYIDKIQTLLFGFLILVLVYFLGYYGLDKLFGLQFYTPSSNILHTPVGQLSKDILFWTSMGTSPFYNQFMGGIEVVMGGLLLFQRTRFIGLVMSFGLFLNVLAINIGFDITVKYLTGLLLLSTMICLSFYLDIFQIILGRKIEFPVVPKLSNPVMAFLFTPFLMELGYSYIQSQPKQVGRSYQIVSVEGTSGLINEKEMTRIHIHPDGYLILEDKNQEFRSYRLENSFTQLAIQQQKVKITIGGNHLKWQEDNSTLTWVIQEIDLSKMPLIRVKSHIYLEQILERD